MSSDLKNRSVSAVKWAAIGTAVRFVLQIATQVVLARLLGPEIYGLFALGMLVLTFSNFLADFGFSWGLVQNQSLTPEDVRFAFTWQLISGTVAMLSLLLLAPMIALYFNEPRLRVLVCWLSVTCVLNALTTPGSNLLRRKLDFRALNLIQIVSYILGYLLVGITAAYLGAGVWALVGAWLTQAIVAMILTYARAPHSLKPLLWYPGGRRSSEVGATVFVTNLCNWLLNNLDRVFLGRFLNAQAVGLYAVGYNLANTPNSLFLTALQPAFLSAGARLQDDTPRLREAYLSVLSTVWIIIGPVFVLLACIADHLINVLYGSAWAATTPVLMILALAMPAYVSWGMSTPVLWNTKGKHLESILQLPVLALSILALWKFSDFGATAVAFVAAGTLVLRALVIGACACLRLNIGARELLPLLARAVLLACLTAVGAGAGALATEGGPTMLTLVLSSALGVALPLMIALLVPRLIGRRVAHVLVQFSPPLPARLCRYLQSKTV